MDSKSDELPDGIPDLESTKQRGRDSDDCHQSLVISTHTRTIDGVHLETIETGVHLETIKMEVTPGQTLSVLGNVGELRNRSDPDRCNLCYSAVPSAWCQAHAELRVELTSPTQTIETNTHPSEDNALDVPLAADNGAATSKTSSPTWMQ